MRDKQFRLEAARVFDQRAREYDAWFEENPVFAAEVRALQGIAAPLLPPRLEVGVGPGRFAQALGVQFGVDPALAPLHIAAGRGIRVCRAAGEALPVRDNALGTVYLLFTLCFLRDPAAVFVECRRVLRQGGHLVLGFVAAGSPLGDRIAGKKRAGHPFYRHARLYGAAEAAAALTAAGLAVVEIRPGPEEAAGMLILVAEKPAQPAPA